LAPDLISISYSAADVRVAELTRANRSVSPAQPVKTSLLA
jgi:hypothetical protein